MIPNYIRINQSDLKALEEVLLHEGFYDPWIVQEWQKQQVFGLAKELSPPLEWHVRGFNDGHLQSEIELSRRYIGHRSIPAEPFHGPLIRILLKHGIQFRLTQNPPPDPQKLFVPPVLVDWFPLAAFFFSPVFRLCRAFEEKSWKKNSADSEKKLRINFRGLVFATIILSVPLRIASTILSKIPARVRIEIFLRLSYLSSIRPPKLNFIFSISTLRKENKMLFQRFFDSLKLERLAELGKI